MRSALATGRHPSLYNRSTILNMRASQAGHHMFSSGSVPRITEPSPLVTVSRMRQADNGPGPVKARS